MITGTTRGQQPTTAGVGMLLTRVTIRKLASAAFGTAIIAATGIANAQAVVRTVIVGERSVPDTDRVQLSRFADFATEKKIAVGTTLQVGDLMSTAAPDTPGRNV